MVFQHKSSLAFITAFINWFERAFDWRRFLLISFLTGFDFGLTGLNSNLFGNGSQNSFISFLELIKFNRLSRSKDKFFDGFITNLSHLLIIRSNFGFTVSWHCTKKSTS